MSFNEVINVIDQAKELGLESVKFLGPGELLANPKLFSILDAFVKRDIVIGIFTKGAIMGNDSLARYYHGVDSEELTRRLVLYPNVTFLVGGRSFDPSFENIKFIPQNKKEFAEEFDYHEARNIAIERLCCAGMNADLVQQRIAIACSPITAQNISGAFEIYRWGVERNIPEGVHPYIGIAPCNQLTHGLYVHHDGAVWRCPGNDTQDFIVHPNVRDKSLLDIWVNSINYPINLFNNRCVKDGVSLPRRFYTEVLERVRLSIEK